MFAEILVGDRVDDGNKVDEDFFFAELLAVFEDFSMELVVAKIRSVSFYEAMVFLDDMKFLFGGFVREELALEAGVGEPEFYLQGIW